MRILAILPPFLPIEEIKGTVNSILPGIEVSTNTDFQHSDCEVLIVTTFTPVDSKLISKMPEVKFIQVASTGYDNVDLSALKEKGIHMSNIPIANKESVAEHVIAMVLAILKNLIFFDKTLRSGTWPVLTNSRELSGKVFGIVGMGAIGKKLAERLLFFGANIIYYDPVRLTEDQEESLGARFSELDPLLQKSDIVSIHLPLTDSTEGLFDMNKFSRMKGGAIFINTSRGEVVVEDALIEAIKKRGIMAGIDVYPKEPPDFSSELFSLDNVIFSPHIAGVTMESQGRFITETISNVLKYVQGIDPLYRVI